jgi:hypothetical protein
MNSGHETFEGYSIWNCSKTIDPDTLGWFNDHLPVLII